MSNKHPLQELIEALAAFESVSQRQKSREQEKKSDAGFKEFEKQRFFAMVAPNGVVQTTTLSPNPHMVKGIINMMADKGICESYETMRSQGFKLMPLFLSVSKDEKNESSTPELKRRDQMIFMTWDKCQEGEVNSTVEVECCPHHAPEYIALMMQKDEFLRHVLVNAVEIYHDKA